MARRHERLRAGAGVWAIHTMPSMLLFGSLATLGWLLCLRRLLKCSWVVMRASLQRAEDASPPMPPAHEPAPRSTRCPGDAHHRPLA